MISRQKTTVKGVVGENYLQFNYFDISGQEKEVIVSPPAMVRLKKNFFLSFSPTKGTINRMTRLEFTTTVEPFRVYYQYFIGSGRFEKRIQS